MMTVGESGDFFTAQYTVTALEDVVMGVLDLMAIQSVIAARQYVKITMIDLKMIAGVLAMRNFCKPGQTKCSGCFVAANSQMQFVA